MNALIVDQVGRPSAAQRARPCSSARPRARPRSRTRSAAPPRRRSGSTTCERGGSTTSRSRGDLDADLVIVGGGYTGLWTALRARRARARPARRAARGARRSAGRHPVATAGSARRASPTATRTAASAGPTRSTRSTRLGLENLDDIEATVRRYGMDVDFERTGILGGGGRAAPGRRGSRDPTPRTGTTSSSTRRRCAPRSPRRRTSRGRVGPPHERARAPGKLAARARPRRRRGAASRSSSARRCAASTTPGRRRGRHRPRRACAPTQGRARDERVPLAAPAQHAHDGAGVRLRADDRAALDEQRRARLERPPGRERPGQPVPLLPAERRRPHPVRRLRRRVPLRRARPRGVREPARDVREAREPLPHDVPAARGHAVHASLGGRDRHVLAVLRVLRPRARGQGRVRGGFHRARRRRDPLRRRGHARPAGRRRDRAHVARDGARSGRCRSRPSRPRRSAST